MCDSFSCKYNVYITYLPDIICRVVHATGWETLIFAFAYINRFLRNGRQTYIVRAQEPNNLGIFLGRLVSIDFFMAPKTIVIEMFT